MTRIRLWIILTIFIVLIGNSVNATANSVFAEDTCAPPCWFGLIAGQSTSADVENLLAEYAVENVEVYGAFDSETHQLITGVYEFELLKRENSSLFARIQIRDTLVYTIVLLPTKPNRFPDTTPPEEYITLQQALTTLGQPEIVYFDNDDWRFGNHSFRHVIFIYLELRLRIEFYEKPYVLASCSLQSIGEDMFLEKMTYYSPEGADERSHHIGRDELQSALTALTVGDEVVTKETWQQVMNGEIDETCGRLPTVYYNPATTPIIYDEPDQPRSLFDEDTCAPPCWMGLTTGDSTAEDVSDMIQTTSAIFRGWESGDTSLFDEQTGRIVSGGYSSRWVFNNRDDVAYYYNQANFAVRDGIVGVILIIPNRTILLHEVLRRLGTPNEVSMSWHEVSGSSLTFDYYDLRLHISLNSIRQCYMDRMSNNFYVSQIDYNPPSSFHQFSSTFSRDVPIEVWQQWVNGEETRSCSTAWYELPESP
jgi:hypothetical protein